MGVVLLSCQVLKAMARQPALDSRSPVLCLAPAPGSAHPWYCGFPALVDIVFGGFLKTTEFKRVGQETQAWTSFPNPIVDLFVLFFYGENRKQSV